jgi:hypothetical protein
MAFAAILKINYTLRLPYLWADFTQTFTIALYHLAVFENAIKSRIRNIQDGGGAMVNFSP